MMKFVHRDAFHVITFPDEIITFTTLASYLHVHIRKQSVSVVVIAINEGAEIYGLEVVENLEVLFNHTPVVDFISSSRFGVVTWWERTSPPCTSAQ